MALKPCRECGEKVSSFAAACPKCGKKHPTFGFGDYVGGIFVFVALILILSHVFSTDDNNKAAAAAALVALRAAKWGYDPQTSVWGHGEVNPGHKEADEGLTIASAIRNGTLPVAVPSGVAASAPPVRLAAAGVSDVEPGMSRISPAEANVSDPSVTTPRGSTGPGAGDDYWSQVYPEGIPGADRAAPNAAGPPLPWNAVGAPVSNQAAPPSLYTASSPQQQQAWQASSTPLGYALMRQLAGQPAPGSSMFPGSPPAPTGVLTREPLPPPASPTAPPPSNIAIPGPAIAAPPGVAGSGPRLVPVGYDPFAGPGAMQSGSTAQPPGARNLSDADLARLTPEDVLGAVSRTDLTNADRAALAVSRIRQTPGGRGTEACA
jgi:hypothetical protein